MIHRRKTSQDWYENNLERHAETSRRWREENTERCKELERRYYVENKEQIDEKNLLWRKENPERAKEIARRWRENHPEYGRDWKRENADRVAGYSSSRRALKAGSNVHSTPVTISALRELRDNDDCWWCLEPLDFEMPRSVHIDHVWPLSDGGDHAVDNCVLACSICNESKGSKILNVEWEPIVGQPGGRVIRGS